MRVFVTGASGFIGKRLLRELLRRGDRVVALTRRRANLREASSDTGGSGDGRLTVVEGDPGRAGPWQQALAGCDAVVTLAGEPIVGERWTEEFKRRVRDSRVEGMRRLGEALAACPEAERPKVLVGASAVGIYGSRGDEVLDEDASPGHDFVAELCADWEAQARTAATPHGVRVTLLRIGVVLGLGGGMMAKVLPAFRAFVGGPLGDGKQWLPWVHIDDVVGAILWALDTPASASRGSLNLAAPQPVRMREFADTLGAVLHRPALLPVPRFAVKLLLGEGAKVALTSQRVLPKRLQELGYTFRHPELRAALTDLVQE